VVLSVCLATVFYWRIKLRASCERNISHKYENHGVLYLGHNNNKIHEAGQSAMSWLYLHSPLPSLRLSSHYLMTVCYQKQERSTARIQGVDTVHSRHCMTSRPRSKDCPSHLSLPRLFFPLRSLSSFITLHVLTLNASKCCTDTVIC